MLINPTHLDSIISSIERELKNAHHDQNNKNISRDGWTTKFFRVLSKIGVDNDYLIYCSKSKQLQKEFSDKMFSGWLFDLCWSNEDTKSGEQPVKFYGLPLICESEWDMKDEKIIEDFQKLFIARADIKLMIVQFNNNKLKWEHIKQICERSVDNKLLDPNELYFLFGSANFEGDESFKFEQLFVESKT